MKSFEIYRKTLGLSLLRMACSLLGLSARFKKEAEKLPEAAGMIC